MCAESRLAAVASTCGTHLRDREAAHKAHNEPIFAEDNERKYKQTLEANTEPLFLLGSGLITERSLRVMVMVEMIECMRRRNHVIMSALLNSHFLHRAIEWGKM